MDYEDFLAERLALLRIKCGVSARDMSLSLGQSPNYINKIEGGKNLPSMRMFFYICEYLKISPQEFFAEDVENPARIRKITEKLKLLNEKQLCALEIMIDTLLEGKKSKE